MTEICFFGLCPITPTCVNNATKFGSSAVNLLLVARVDKRIGFLNREVGSCFYWSFRMHGVRNANVNCSAPLCPKYVAINSDGVSNNQKEPGLGVRSDVLYRKSSSELIAS